MGAALQKEDGRNRKGSKAAHANSTIARHGRGRKRRPGGGRRGARAHRHRVVVRTVTGVLSESETSIVCMRRCAWRRRWRRRWEAEGLSAFDFGASCGCEFGRSTDCRANPFFFSLFAKNKTKSNSPHSYTQTQIHTAPLHSKCRREQESPVRSRHLRLAVSKRCCESAAETNAPSLAVKQKQNKMLAVPSSQLCFVKKQQPPLIVATRKSAGGGVLARRGRAPAVRCHAGTGGGGDDGVEVQGDWRAFRCVRAPQITTFLFRHPTSCFSYLIYAFRQKP